MRQCEKIRRAKQATDDNITRRMRFACWITKVKDTHWKYLILIAFSRQQWLRERAAVLRHTYYAWLANSNFLQYEHGTDFDGGKDSTIGHPKYIM
jgi:hypothetical protein